MVTGDFTFNGPAYDPLLHPAPPDYYQLKISALPYCFPAIVAYLDAGGDGSEVAGVFLVAVHGLILSKRPRSVAAVSVSKTLS